MEPVEAWVALGALTPLQLVRSEKASARQRSDIIEDIAIRLIAFNFEGAYLSRDVGRTGTIYRTTGPN
jgi:hypothetical protein